MNKITKRIIVGLMVIVFLLSMSINGCQRKRLVDYTKKITTIENINTQLLTTIKNKDLKIVLIDGEISKLEAKNSELESENNDLKTSRAHLEDSLATISPSVEDITPDSSYTFLQAVLPYEGILQYSFNTKQVKAIHVIYLERMTLRDLSVNLQAQVDNLSHQLQFSEAIQRKLLEQREIYKSKEEDYKEIISNKDEKFNLQEKQVKKEKRKVVLYKVTTGIAAGLIILIAL